VNFPINVRQYRIDGTTVTACNLGQNVPVNLLQPEACGQPVKPDRARLRLREVHIEAFDEWIVLNLKTSMSFLDFPCSILTHLTPFDAVTNTAIEMFEIKSTTRLSSPIHQGLTSRTHTQMA
jgi:hypothetical protein